MKRFTVLCFLSVFMCVIFAPRAWADVAINETNFPDATFRTYVSENCDSDKDGYLSAEEIAAVATLALSSKGISSLKGVEYFTALTTLNCYSNQLTELDVSNNTALTKLSCQGNQLTALDVSKNTALTTLDCRTNLLTELDVSSLNKLETLECYSNGLTKLDVSNNTALWHLNCGNNQLTALDVSKNTALTDLYCNDNQLTTLDLSNNTVLAYLNCSENQLTALDLSNNTALMGVACAGQKVSGFSVIFTGDTSFPYNMDFSGYISADKIANIASVTAKDSNDAEITATYADGVAQFASLPSTVTYNYATGYSNSVNSNSVMDVTLSDFSLFIEINGTIFPDETFRSYVSSNCDTDNDGYLSEEEIAAVTEITVGWLIQSLKGIEHFTALTTLNCNGNSLTALDVSSNTALTDLNCNNNKLTALNVSKNTALTTLHCSSNQLTALDVSNSTALTDLYCDYNKLTALDVSKNTALTTLYCYSNQLTALDVSSNTALTTLYCHNNQLTALDVSSNTALEKLYCYSNQLTVLDVSSNTNLTSLNCSGQKVSGSNIIYTGNATYPYEHIFSWDISADKITNIDSVTAKASNTEITVSYADGTVRFASLPSTVTYNYATGKGNSVMDVTMSGFSLFIEINGTTFPDATFRTYVSENCDSDKDGYLSAEEIAAVTGIDVNSKEISSLKGVEYFTALTDLRCYNNQLTELDVSKNTALTRLECSYNQLTALDVSKNTKLTYLTCYSNQLTELDVSNNTALQTLDCTNNQLTALDVSNNTALTYLSCGRNQMTALDVSNTALKRLECNNNLLTTLDVGKNTALEYLFCTNNQLTALDVSNNAALIELDCGNNQLTALDVSNNTALVGVGCAGQKVSGFSVIFTGDTSSPYKIDFSGYISTGNFTKISSFTAKDSNDAEITTTYANGVAQFASLPSTVTYNYATGKTAAMDVTMSDFSLFIEINGTIFPDEKFRAYVSGNFDSDKDGYLSEEEMTAIKAATFLDVSGQSISSLKGIEYFTALTVLYCGGNELTALDVSSNTALTQLACDSNQLTALDVSNNTALTWLNCYSNQLATLDVSKNTNLTSLTCGGQKISGSNIIYTGDATYPYEHIFSWDISADKIANISDVAAKDSSDAAITVSYADGTARFASLPSKVTYNYATGYSDSVMDVTLSDFSLSIEINGTTFPDEKFRAYVSENFNSDKDGYLSEEEIAAVTNIDVSGQSISSLKGIEHFTALTTLYCSNNALSAIDLSGNTALTTLDCSNNQLTALDVSSNTALTALDCTNNQLTALDLSSNTALTGVACAGQKVSGFSVIFTGDTSSPYKIDFSGYISTGNFTKISSFTAKDSNDAEITVSYADGVAQFASLPSTVTYNYATGKTAAMDVTMSDFSLFIEINGTIFPDEKFRAYVSNNFDSDKDGYLSEEEMTAIKAATTVDVSGQGISSLNGIEYFTALTTLNCSNNKLTELDVSNNAALQSLQCNNNQLSELDLRNCPSLTPNSITADSNVRIIHGNMDGLPSFTDHSLILSGQLGLDFYANVPEGTNTEGAYTDFTVNDKTGSPEMFSNAEKVGDDYRFTCYVNSVQMADNITAKFCYSDDTKNMAAVQDCTVTDYLDAIISSDDLRTKSPDLVALAGAIKDYGHYVQIPLARYNSWNIGADHAEIECANQNIDSDSADIKAKLEAYALSKDIEGSGIENLTYDLELDSEITLNIYLTPGNDAGNVSAYITDDYGDFDGKTNMAVYDPSENAYVVTISGISAHKLGRVYTVSITTGKGSGFTVKMSALSYANGVMQAENDGENIDDDLKRAVISLYKYYIATMTYRDPTFTE